TFRLTLPLRAVREHITNKPEDGASQMPDLANQVMLDGLRIVVVDDESETRELLTVILSSRGADVKTASSASEGLALIENWRPTIIVSDIGMPHEDGYTFIRKVRQLNSRRSKLPAIALTAYARAEDRMRALAAGFQMHVPKPVEADELVMVI